ncbi:hypothetical protein TB1_046004 [Malus domestica]
MLPKIPGELFQSLHLQQLESTRQEFSLHSLPTRKHGGDGKLYWQRRLKLLNKLLSIACQHKDMEVPESVLCREG